MRVQQAFADFAKQLQAVYSASEAGIIAGWVFEKLAGMPTDVIRANPDQLLDTVVSNQLAEKLALLLAHQPVQYVLEEAWFYKMRWSVNENVLIPRPETEELVEMVNEELRMKNDEWGDTGGRMLDTGYGGFPDITQQVGQDRPDIRPTDNESRPTNLGQRSTNPGQRPTTNSQRTPANKPRPSILDIGTGSGCIAVTLQKLLPSTQVTAVDVSAGALAVAQQNAINHNASVGFLQLDFLNRDNWPLLGKYDAIVSNPPYIPQHEKEKLDAHVAAYEPGLALFVPDNNPLLFYEAIAAFGLQHLQPGGFIAVETHEDYAQQTADVFRRHYRSVTVKQDLFGKERMVLIS